MTLLVTGATGKLGNHVVETLLAQGLANDIAVSVRNPERAGHFQTRGVDMCARAILMTPLHSAALSKGFTGC